eukprot:6144393-Pyramimonas_sp.AAC.1
MCPVNFNSNFYIESREANQRRRQGTYRSRAETREPQNPTKSEEYQRRPQGFPGARIPRRMRGTKRTTRGGKVTVMGTK